MIGNQRELPTIAWDDEVFDRWVLDVVEELRRRRPVSGVGMAIDELPSGTVFNCTIPDNAPRHARTQGSGIAAAASVTQMTSGTVDLWGSNATGALSDTTVDVVVWNKATTAIPANTHIMFATDAQGQDVIVWVACTP